MNARQLMAIVLGAAGFASVAMLAPRALQQPADPVRLDGETGRRSAIEAVRSLWGVDITGWEMKIEPSYRYALRMWQEKYAKPGLDTAVTPAYVDLKFTDPSKSRNITVQLARSGRVVEVEGKPTSRSARKGEARKDVTNAERAELARKAFALFAGEYAAKFHEDDDAGAKGVQSNEFRWLAPSSHSSMEWEIEVKTEKDGLRRARLYPRLDDAERKSLMAPVGSLGDTAAVVGLVVRTTGIVILCVLFLIAWLRKMVDKRSALTVFVIVYASDLVTRALLGNMKLGRAAALSGIALLFAVAFGASQIAARETEWAAWRELRLLLGRQWRARGIYSSIAWGMLWGGVLAAIPLAIRVSGLFPGAYLDRVAWLVAAMGKAPAAGAVDQIFDVKMTALFVALLPWLTQRIGIRWAALTVFVPMAAAFSFYSSPVISSFPAGVAYAALTVLVSLAIYLRLGTLAVLAAGSCSEAVTYATLLLNSDSARLHESGLWVFGGLAVAGMAMVAITRFAEEAEPVDAMAARFLSNRERLKAEFSMAQQAQQRLLPAVAPALPGFAIATACQPAKDVGGDLFDYFRLRDGRFGLCVADVSGKGMPAALYMTLTKGLLAAASPEATSLTDLARRVNRHLYVACKRKMFVTAAMAAVDPTTRQVEYLRAGHNPALLWQAASGKARYLTTPGVGLGLAGPALFDRGARTETFSLASGDVMVFYSDGVTEAMNEALDLFGEDRLQQILERTGRRTAAEVLEAIRQELAVFTGAEPAHDDITLLVLQTL